MPFASRRLWEASVDVSVCASGVDILDAIKETLQEMQVQTADLVKVCLTGSLPVGVEVDTDLLAMQLSQIYFYAKVVDHTVPEIDYAAYMYDASLRVNSCVWFRHRLTFRMRRKRRSFRREYWRLPGRRSYETTDMSY